MRRALDGNDNLLPNRDHTGSPLDEPRMLNAVGLTRVYLDKVQALLRHFVTGRPDYPIPHDMSLSQPALRGASYAEAYLEFYSDDAISAVEDIRAAAIAGMVDPAWRTFAGRRIDGAMQRNSSSISVGLTKDVRVTIYAKTPRTVRAEVHYLANVREHAFNRNERGASRSPIQELDGLRPDTVNRLSELFGALAMHYSATTRRSVFDLVDALYRSVGGDAGRARDLLSQLGNLGGITETDESGLAPPSTIRLLQGEGVIHRARYRHGNAEGQRRFAVTPDFAAALPALLERTDGSLPN